MSGWTFSCTIDVSKLDAIASRLNNVPEILGQVADQVSNDVQSNIKNKDIIDTGALLRSINWSASANESRVMDGVEYGVYNEFGTYKMAARPFFVPAVEKAGQMIISKFVELFR